MGPPVKHRPATAGPWRLVSGTHDPRCRDGNPRVGLYRDGRRHFLPPAALLRAAFPEAFPCDRPPAVEYRPVPGFPGYEVGSDGSFWIRAAGPEWTALGTPGPWERVPPAVRPGNQLAVRLVRDGRPHELPTAALVAEAFPPAEAIAAAPPAPPSAEAPAVEYRDAPGFPGYRVGSDRSVWSDKSGDWRRLAPRRLDRGGPSVCLSRDGRPCERSVDRLYREAFPPPPPPGHPGGPLRLGPGARGSDHGRARLTEALVTEARRLKSEGWSYPELARRYGVGKVTLFYAITGKTWRHVPAERQPAPPGVEPT